MTACGGVMKPPHAPWLRTNVTAATAAATPAVCVLLEFVVEDVRKPSGGKSCAGQGYSFCVISIGAGQFERADSVSDRVHVDRLLGDAEALVSPHGLVLYDGLRWIDGRQEPGCGQGHGD